MFTVKLTTVKPLYSGYHRDQENVPAMRRCPLFKALSLSSKEMTFKSLSGLTISGKECERKLMETSLVCYIFQPRKSNSMVEK